MYFNNRADTGPGANIMLQYKQVPHMIYKLYAPEEQFLPSLITSQYQTGPKKYRAGKNHPEKEIISTIYIDSATNNLDIRNLKILLIRFWLNCNCSLKCRLRDRPTIKSTIW